MRCSLRLWCLSPNLQGYPDNFAATLQWLNSASMQPSAGTICEIDNRISPQMSVCLHAGEETDFPKEICAMRFFKIFPAAAGIIALTATVSFARDQRECEDEGFCRTSIAECAATGNAVDVASSASPAMENGERANVYQVAITRGHKSWLVYVDAYTGKVLDKRDI